MEILVSEIKEMFDNFTKEEWDDIKLRLSYFFFIHYGRESRLAREDLIQDAILRVYEGRRHWPEGIKLVTLLCGVMRSDASHILKKENKNRVQSIEEISEKALLQPAGMNDALQLRDELRDLTTRDPLLSRLVEFLFQDPKMRPRDMVAVMPDVSKSDIYNAFRRLNKLIDKLKKEQGNG